MMLLASRLEARLAGLCQRLSRARRCFVQRKLSTETLKLSEGDLRADPH